MTDAIVRLAREYGRYGYRRIIVLLRVEGWWMNRKRIERIRRCEGLKLQAKQWPQGRLWLTDGPCVRQRPMHQNHVQVYDFVAGRTTDGCLIKLLTIMEEHTRECLAIEVERRLCSNDALHRLGALFVQRGAPKYIRSNNGP